MGSKTSDAPAPDPRLVEAQLKSMGIQDSAIQRIMANADRLMPLQEEQMQFGLETARTAYDQSQDDREWMLGRRGQLTNLQNRLTADAKEFNTDDRREQLAGEAIGDVRQAFDQGRQMQMRGLQRMGVNPNDGKFAAMSNQMAMGEALAQSTAANKVRQAARMEGYALTDRATNALSGFPAMSMQATQAGAGFGGMGLDTANKGLAGMNSGFGAGATAAGQMGSNATNMWSAQGNYKNQQDQIAGSNDPFGTVLGAAAGGWASGGFKFSDRRLKENITLVGRDERTGLNLYEFSYINGSGRLFRGVMADEVEVNFPHAVFEMPNGFKAVNYAALGIEMVLAEGEPA